MRLQLRLQYAEQMAGEIPRLRDVLAEAFDYLTDASLVDAPRVNIQSETGRPFKVNSARELRETILAWDDGSYKVYSDEDAPLRCELKIDVSEQLLWLLMVVGGEGIEKFGDVLLQQWSGLVEKLVNTFQRRLFFGPHLQVEIYEVVYPRPRPLRRYRLSGDGNVVDYFSKEFHARHPQGRPADLQRILTASLPDWVTREERGDLVIVRWIDGPDLKNEAALRQKMAFREQFLYDLFDLPIEEGWNEAGDNHVPLMSVREHPPLTFYSPAMQIGFKAVYAGADNESVDETLTKLGMWLKQKELPDGTPLKAVALILPSRESALAVRERASARGIHDVFYVDKEGRLWNPFPLGEWQT